MATAERWLLPDGIEEILPPRAARLEQLRRDLLDERLSRVLDFQCSRNCAESRDHAEHRCGGNARSCPEMPGLVVAEARQLR